MTEAERKSEEVIAGLIELTGCTRDEALTAIRGRSVAWCRVCTVGYPAHDSFLRPDRICIGCESDYPEAVAMLRALDRE